jgi:hypothetical protein
MSAAEINRIECAEGRESDGVIGPISPMELMGPAARRRLILKQKRFIAMEIS